MNLVENKNLLDSVDARTGLAGSNKMEILLFSLGTTEKFSASMSSRCAKSADAHITKTPNMPRGVEGLISLRGNVIPVLSLAAFMQLDGTPPGLGKTMMVAEYSKRTLGFLVHEVDRIIRVDWERVKRRRKVS
jgi:two-component system, chemotaxis family, chemotaxis protein CheV